MIRSWNVRACGKGVNIANYVCLNPDVLCVGETHISDEAKKNLSVDGYTWVGNNEKVVSKKAIKTESET